MCVLFCNLFSEQIDIPGKMRRHFEWGEYDSLSATVQAALTTSTHVSDSEFISECHTYLGVVSMSRGNISEARREFETAYQYNPSVELDSMYVSPEIYQLFRLTNQEYARTRRESARQDSILKAQERTQRINEELKASLKREQKRRLTMAVSIVSLSITALCGAEAIYEYVQADKAYQDFKNAALQGDRANYDRSKKIVQQHDAYTVAFGCGSIVTGIAGVYFAMAPVFGPGAAPARPGPGSPLKTSLKLSYEIIRTK
jgi:hypothetical protein